MVKQRWKFLKDIMKNNILITSAGRRVSLVRAFQRELKKIFPDAKVITTDSHPELSAACMVSDKAIKICKINHPNYIDELLTICNSNEVGIIIPTLDTELRILAEKKAMFRDTHIIVSSLDFIDKCRDKRKTNFFFVEKGISVPQEINKDNPTFPLFIKPFNGSLSSEIHHIQSVSQLTQYLLTDEKFMFMEYLSPQEHDEYTVDMYYDKNHELKCLVPRKRIEIRGGEVSKGITLKNEIFRVIPTKMAKLDGAIGCLTLQVFLNKVSNKIIGIEINPRFGGGFPLSYLAGANFPKWLIMEYILGETTIEIYNEWEENLLMLRYDDEILIHNYH
jgi:carbamoyl-phosphate synthase large subunit